jgi:hypothetical protein
VKQNAKIVLAIAIAIHILFIVSLVHPSHFLSPLFAEGAHNIGNGPATDFFAFYQAGRYVIEGKNIYQDPMKDPDRVVPYAYFYRYLPFVAYTIGVASNAVSPWAAYWIWLAIVELLLLLAIRSTRRMVTDTSLFAYLAAMWLMFTPFYLEQFMGQLTFVMSVLIFAFALSYARGKMTSFDWSWTLSVVLKHLTLIYLPILIRIKRYRTIAIGVALLAATALPYYLLGPSSDVSRFARSNFDLSLYPLPGNYGVLALLMAVKMHLFPRASEIGFQIGPLKMSITRMLILGTMLAPVLVSLWITFRRKPFDFIESLGLWTMVYFFVFREVWEYHYVLLLPLFVLFYAKTRARVLWGIYALTAAPTLFVFLDIPGGNLIVDWSAFVLILNHVFKVIPLVWLFVWVARGHLRQHARRMEKIPESGLAVTL